MTEGKRRRPICSCCGLPRDRDDFYRNGPGRPPRRQCMECCRRKERERYWRDPVRRRRESLERHRRRLERFRTGKGNAAGGISP